MRIVRVARIQTGTRRNEQGHQKETKFKMVKKMNFYKITNIEYKQKSQIPGIKLVRSEQTEIRELFRKMRSNPKNQI